MVTNMNKLEIKMSKEEKSIAVSNYVYWLTQKMPDKFMIFIEVFVKLIFFINNIPYEYLLNTDKYEEITDVIFEQETEMID